MPVRNRFAELHDEITGWRRDFHAHPELQFEVHRTAARVADLLRDFGCDEVVEGVGKTGVVGIIKGQAEGARCVGLRADMDALPIEEATGLDYASTVPGTMHACGHDGHTAMLLGAAKYLAETRNFAGSVAVIFQPAEEGGGGGREMVNDGMLDRFGIDEVYGLHNIPGRTLGEFAIRPGNFYAATGVFEIEMHGRGGHAAYPHEAVDPILASSQTVLALQSIVSRSIDPMHSVVVSVTSLESITTTHNVIPDNVLLKGTTRTMNATSADITEERFRQIVEATAKAHGCRAVIRYDRNYPGVVNSEAETDYAASAAAAVSGDCAEAEPTMWGEDFAFFLQERPGAYIHLGIGDASGLHTPEYNFNDDAIPFGCSWFVELAESRLAAV
ncbi:MAG: M20 aminoacylase family protein [Pseudomonadota bacterium]